MKLFRITEIISEQRREGSDFALEIVVTRRFVRRARRAAKRGDRGAMYRVWAELCDFAWARIQARYGLPDADRYVWGIGSYASWRNKPGVTHHPMSVP